MTDELGIAIGTDGVGSKLVVAEQTGRLDTVGIDCIAMNVNDVVCVGAEPIAVLDYLAVEQADPDAAARDRARPEGGRRGGGRRDPGRRARRAARADPRPPVPARLRPVRILLRDRRARRDRHGRGRRARRRAGRPAVERPALQRLHARPPRARALGYDDRPPELGGATVADALLEPTVIYVRAALDLLRSDIPVHGLAHITGGGLTNLLRLNRGVGYAIETPLPVPGIFALVQRLGAVDAREMWDVFNMGCGFVCVVSEADAARAVALLDGHHPGAARIGTVTDRAGEIGYPA